MDTKLCNFQYRLMLGKIFLNKTLFKWKIVESPFCEWCGGLLQTIPHLFWKCERVQKLWKYIINLTTEISEYEWNLGSILRNSVHAKPTHGMNQLILICKYFIFQSKCLNKIPNIQGMINIIKDHYLIQRYNVKIMNSVDKIASKWEPVLPLFM